MQTIVIHIKHKKPWVPAVLWNHFWRWLPGVWSTNEIRVPVGHVRDVAERLSRT